MSWEWRSKSLKPVSYAGLIRNLVGKAELKPRVSIKKISEAVGLIAAEDVVAHVDSPEKNLSRVDGYAVLSEDLKGASEENPVKLRIVDIDPRKAGDYKIRSGEAVPVDTGFPLPEHADACIPVEDAVVADGYIIVKKPVRRGENVIARGVDFKRGFRIVASGERILESHLRAMVEAGYHKVRVYEPPKVTIYSIGSELVGLEESGGVRETNSILARILLEPQPCLVEFKGLLNDDLNEIREAVGEEAVGNSSIILLLSGSSIGRKDYTWQAMNSVLKSTYSFRGVSGLEGKSLSGASVRGKVFLNVPGFPRALVNGVVLIASRIVSYLNGLGYGVCYPCENVVNIEKYVSTKCFYRVRFIEEAGVGMARILDWPSPNSSSVISRASGFLVLEPWRSLVNVGEELFIQKLFCRGRLVCRELV